MSIDSCVSAKFMFRAVYSVSLFWLALKLGNVNAQNGPYCYAEDKNPYVRFGTSSSYQLIFPNPNLEISKACTPVYTYGLIRVGARYFSGYDGDHLITLQKQILENHDAKRGDLCRPDLDLLRSWSSKGSRKTSDDLTAQGEIEVLELGRRLGLVFRTLAENKLENFSFTMTSNKTSEDSTAAFIEGMIGRKDGVRTSKNDDLRFLENDPSLQSLLTEPALEMRQTCAGSEPMKKLIKDVSRDRLGFTQDLPINSIADLYFACAFETAWAPKQRANFCAAFTKEHLELLEYCYMDVFGYYEWGHGAKHVHNPILNDLLQKFTAALNASSGPLKADFNIISGAALTHTIAKLGLYRDDTHLPLNCGERKPGYKWLMTNICPFAGNLIAVLHKCDNEEPKVSLYHNERPIKVPGCSHELCPWSQFQKNIEVNNLPTAH